MPLENDNITNSDESKRLPDQNPDPITGPKTDAEKIAKPDFGGSVVQATQSDFLDSETEGARSGGNVAAWDEEDTYKLDGSNANNLRTK